MTVEECIEFMPRFLGSTFYPGGFPIKEYNFEGVPIMDIYFRFSMVSPVRYEPKGPNDETILIAYTLYYINAPIFDSEYTE